MAVVVERGPCVVLPLVVALPIQMCERRGRGCYVQIALDGLCYLVSKMRIADTNAMLIEIIQ